MKRESKLINLIIYILQK